MSKYRQPPDNIVKAHQDVDKRVSKLERNPRLPNSSVDSGDTTIRGGNFSYVDPATGQTLVRFGDIGSPLLRGWIFRRLSGAPAIYLNGTAGGEQFWALADLAGNFVVTDDIASGQGLGRPYIPYFALPHSKISTPESTTASTTFVNMYRIQGLKQHPKMTTDFLATTPAGVTAEIRLVDTQNGGAVTAGPMTVTAGTPMSYKQLITDVQGNFLGGVMFDLQMRVASGAGTVGVTYVDSYGRQT